MNTSRAVLCSPHAISTPHPRFPLQTYQILVASILMMSPLTAQSQDTSHTPEAPKVVPWEDMSQLFEGFTPKLKYDPEHSTWNIWYGTDIGQKLSHWPYGTYAEDVAELLKQEWLTLQAIENILNGSSSLSQDLAKKLFDMRYEYRKDMLILRYQELFHKKFTDLPLVVQNMLVDFSYNMRGTSWILPSPWFPWFPEAYKALQKEDWAAFAHEIADSNYADQVWPRRAGYWVYQLTELSRKPLQAMTSDVKEEVASYEKVQPEIEARIEMILAYNHQRGER